MRPSSFKRTWNNLYCFAPSFEERNKKYIKRKITLFFSWLANRTTKIDDLNVNKPMKCECNSKKYEDSFNKGFLTEERKECYDLD